MNEEYKLKMQMKEIENKLNLINQKNLIKKLYPKVKINEIKNIDKDSNLTDFNLQPYNN